MSADESQDRFAVMRHRTVLHLEQIEDDRAYFDSISADLGEEGWTSAWMRRGTPEQGRDLRALERSYEQIVNDLQELLGLTEEAAAEVGIVPDPDATGHDWWDAADALGLVTEGANRTDTPGRWRRLAFYGGIDHDVRATSSPAAMFGSSSRTATPTGLRPGQERCGRPCTFSASISKRPSSASRASNRARPMPRPLSVMGSRSASHR